MLYIIVNLPYKNNDNSYITTAHWFATILFTRLQNRGKIVSFNIQFMIIICCKYVISAFLTHWDRVTHICVNKLTIVDSDNDLSPGRRQAIIWTNAGVLLIGPIGTNFNEILIKIHALFIKENPFQIIVWKMAAILSRPQCVSILRPRVFITPVCGTFGTCWLYFHVAHRIDISLYAWVLVAQFVMYTIGHGWEVLWFWM